MRMLIVDDSMTMRRYLHAIAGELAIEADQAVDGQDAMNRLDARNAEFDVALVDWDMPRMNGVQFVRAVRARPCFSDMKLMMVTAHNAMADIREALAAGADDFLMKPLDVDMVADKLRLLGLLS